jgi:hypothetical protein
MENPEGFGVMDEVDVGDLGDIKEEGRPLVPPTKDVKLIIKRVAPGRSRMKEQEGIPEGSYRWLNIGFQLVDGIAEGKFKNMYVNSDMICYYADPAYYPKSTGEHKGLFFGKLADLQKATGTVGNKINDTFIADITNKIVLGNIEQQKNNKSGELENVVRFLRVLPANMSV